MSAVFEATLREEPLSGLRHLVRPAVPAAHDAPRLVLLHGVGGNETNLVSLADAIDPRVAVHLVRGPLTLGPGQHAWFQVRFGAQGPVIDAPQADASRRQLIRFLDALRAADGDALTVIAGFSQGGILSASVALTAPASVRGFAVLSGRILPELEPMLAPPDALAAVRGFIAHGRFDDKLPVAWAERADAWLTALGVPHDTAYYPIGHGVSAEMVRDFTQWLTGPLFSHTITSIPS